MEKIRKKKRREHPRARAAGICVLLCLAALSAFSGFRLYQKSRQVEVTPKEMTDGVFVSYETSDVKRVEVVRPKGDGWAVTQTEEGVLVEDGGFTVAENRAKRILEEAAVIEYEDVFTEDRAEYADRLDEFGLDPAGLEVRVRYADGVSLTFFIGDECVGTGYRYMTTDRADGLYALAGSVADEWNTGIDSLRAVEQPVLHPARMDRIIFTSDDAQVKDRAWELTGSISDSNAADTWVLTEPWAYPADGTAMRSFLSNIGNIRMGTYVGEADGENLAFYGFDRKLTMFFHMAQGFGTQTVDGAVRTVVYPETETVLTVSLTDSGQVKYVAYAGSIYRCSSLTLSPVMNIQPADMLSRYPVLVASTDLERLSIEKDGSRVVYEIHREPAEDPESGETLTCFENGVEIPFETFQARYAQMELCTVTGQLPDDFRPEGEPYATYTFESIYGRVHTIRLYAWDALHDAVQVDAYSPVFYLIRDGLGM